MPKLNSRICNNSKLTENTKVRVLSGLHSQFPPLRQQDMDHLRNAAKATQQSPPTVSETYTTHPLAGQDHEQSACVEKNFEVKI